MRTARRLTHGVVGAHDLDLHAGADRAGKDAAEGVEAALVRRGDHLRDVHDERAVGVALADALAPDVVLGASVERAGAVLLRPARRGQVLHEHLQEMLLAVQRTEALLKAQLIEVEARVTQHTERARDEVVAASSAWLGPFAVLVSAGNASPLVYQTNECTKATGTAASVTN